MARANIYLITGHISMRNIFRYCRRRPGTI
jgi:hypothetical protein